LKKTEKDKRTELDLEIERLVEKMKTMEPYGAEYTVASENLKKLIEARDIQTPKRKINWELLVGAGLGLLEILVILGYEHAHVITSKAFTRVTRGRL
jgi:hypothetical protein